MNTRAPAATNNHHNRSPMIICASVVTNNHGSRSALIIGPHDAMNNCHGRITTNNRHDIFAVLLIQ